jgi:peptidoglycan/LPS O-acetylase OafA/YrhL
METVGYSAIGLLFGSILVMTLTAKRTGILQSSALMTVGKYSYALYLFHLPIRAVIRDQFYGPDKFLTVFGSTLPGQLLFYAVATSIAFAAAWLSWHVYEQQFLKLKRYFEPVTQGGAREYEPRFNHAGGPATLVVGAAVWTRRIARGLLSELARTPQIPIRRQPAAQSGRDQRLLAVPAEHYQRATYQPGSPDGGLLPRDPAQ